MSLTVTPPWKKPVTPMSVLRLSVAVGAVGGGGADDLAGAAQIAQVGEELGHVARGLQVGFLAPDADGQLVGARRPLFQRPAGVGEALREAVAGVSDRGPRL